MNTMGGSYAAGLPGSITNRSGMRWALRCMETGSLSETTRAFAVAREELDRVLHGRDGNIREWYCIAVVLLHIARDARCSELESVDWMLGLGRPDDAPVSATDQQRNLVSTVAAFRAWLESGKPRRKAKPRPPEHRIGARLRYAVLRRDGHRCVDCGRGPADGVKLHVDHRVSLANGGATVRENLATTCADCNLGKSAQSTSVAEAAE